jgi:crossover junction endonuclease EME1
MTTEQFFQFVSVCNTNKSNMSDLFQTINDKYKSKKAITIVIIGANSSLNLSKLLTRTSSLKSIDLDNIYLELQLQFNCIIKFAENEHDLALLILSFTKAVTVAPEKRLKNLSPFSFHVDTMKQYKPIRIDIDQGNKTLEQLWKQILQQFPHMGIEQAQAIVNQYGTIQALVQAYKQCQTENQAKLLLADIQVRRGAGVLTTTRKIGPQMSEKIWKLFTSTNENDLL